MTNDTFKTLKYWNDLTGNHWLSHSGPWTQTSIVISLTSIHWWSFWVALPIPHSHLGHLCKKEMTINIFTAKSYLVTLAHEFESFLLPMAPHIITQKLSQCLCITGSSIASRKPRLCLLAIYSTSIFSFCLTVWILRFWRRSIVFSNMPGWGNWLFPAFLMAGW